MGTLDARLMAIDADTGKACLDFGENGAIDLRSGKSNLAKLPQCGLEDPLFRVGTLA